MPIFIKQCEAKDLENKYSNEDRIKYIDDDFKFSLKDLEPYLERLPKKEIDLIHLYYYLKKEQKEIAKILNLSQGGVSHRLSRAKARLRFLVRLPKFTKEELMEDLKDLFEETDLNILWGLYSTTCQSLVAKEYGMTQSRVRHKFMKNLGVLEKNQDITIYQKYYKAFSLIGNNNFNILREISLPKWSSKNKDYIS